MLRASKTLLAHVIYQPYKSLTSLIDHLVLNFYKASDARNCFFPKQSSYSGNTAAIYL